MIPAVQPERDLFRFACQRDGERCDVTIDGDRINALNAKPMWKAVDMAIAEGARDIRINLSTVESIQRVGYSALYAVAEHARREGGTVTIIGATGDVRAMFEYYEITSRFTFLPSEVTL